MDEDRDDEEEDDDPPENVGEQTPHLLKTLDMLKCIVRGQRPSSMGGLFFFACTRNISMYLRPGTVILKFCPTGCYFLVVSSAITYNMYSSRAWWHL
jgi:hypothetical protein